jgi:uncharacterized protein YqeY
VPLSEQQLTADLTAAMKARDAQRTAVLRGVIAAVKNLKVERRGAELGEADLLAVVRKEARQREEAEDYARQAGRDDLVAQNRAERALLDAYVPAALDAAQLEAEIRALVAGPAKTIGAVMTALRERHPGRFDGKQASELARKVLAESSAT